jgi:pre-mRNA cleavage complex 2 protein Pcf11
MSSHSAEVAADFKDALQDLKVNSRPEISNLTIIAKENTEHAQAISRELETHIRTVSAFVFLCHVRVYTWHCFSDIMS